MELIASNIQVLLQAAEYLERREREAEHGYASLSPSGGQDTSRSRRRPKPRKALNSLRSMHNKLEKHRRAQLRQCLEQLKQQVPMNAERSRYTTLSLLHRARLHIKSACSSRKSGQAPVALNNLEPPHHAYHLQDVQKLEEQEQKAQQLKEQLRCEQQNLHQRLEELLGHSSMERLRTDSLDSSRLSSERSDSDLEDAEVDVEGLAFSSIEDDMVAAFSTGQEHSYSNTSNFWL